MKRSLLKATALFGLMLALLIPTATDLLAQRTPIQFFRPYGQDGINVFETTKEDTVPYNGFAIRWGAGFTQQFQGIDHENESPVELIEIGSGFNLATANLNLDVQLAEGVRVNLITYLSSRHHPEAWVKAGYFQVDRLPMLNSDALDQIMEYVTLRVGHMEINYGDAHFRRTDNGNAMYNPFVGNFILDAFTTEIGAEAYVQSNGFLGMIGATNGEIRGEVRRPDDHSPAFYGKLGFDRQLNDNTRFRLTGSAYTTAKSINNTLYAGDRAGSRYYFALEDVDASSVGNFRSGRVNPGFRDKVTALQLNPFVKVGGLEVFGIIEQAKGRAANEPDDRTINQYAGEVLYRFLEGEKVYVGGRYNVVSGDLPGAPDVTVTRVQAGAGWFITPNVMVKGEYVNQTHSDYPATSIFHEGSFNGFMVEAVVAF